MKKRLSYIIFLLSVVSCVKQTDWTFQPSSSDLVAVDAVMTSERKSQTVTLTRPVSDLNAKAEGIRGATVIIHTADSSWTLAEDTSANGVYRSQVPVMAMPDKTYTLNIYHGSRVYSAKANMVPGMVFNPLTYTRNDNDSLCHIDYVASAFSNSQPAMWEVLLDWRKVPGYENADTNKTKARLLFYTLPTLDVSEIFAPVVEQVSFPKGTHITERRYSLTPEHAEFIREMLLETSWQGGLFPTQAANVSTNLSQGAVGYFGVCAVTSLSLVVTK